MRSVVRDSAWWSLAGLAWGAVLAVAAAAAMRAEFQTLVTLIVVVGGAGLCLGPIALIVHRAGQTAGAARLASSAFWGGVWGAALGLLYWRIYDDPFTLGHLLLPAAILATASLLNTAFDVNTQARFDASHALAGRSKPALK
ncbi:MAG: hypothetical protein JW888_11295 [Pirellulales bacterium]|nr:hypothetical protein [Pirellulales bacterium]